MQRHFRRRVSAWVGFLGALLAVSALSGCPGTLDPELQKLASEMGGSNGSGSGGSSFGGNGSGGSSTGSGGSSASCTGGNDGATIVAGNCAIGGCHDSTSANFSGGLDLTVNSSIGFSSRRVMSNGSLCTSSTEPYLTAGSNPATGLLIDKTKNSPPCGSRMPLGGLPLPNIAVTCLTQWATTLTSP